MNLRYIKHMKREEYELQIIDNIRQYRLEKGLTQEQLAQRCDMPVSYISGIEARLRFPKLANLKRIAEGLEVDIAYLISPMIAQRILEIKETARGLNDHIQSYLDEILKATQ